MFVSVSAYSQSIFPAVWINDTTRVLKYDEDMTPYGQYVHVKRYFSDVAPFYTVGEICLIQNDGDTIDLRWDHPMAYGDASVLLPVYNESGALQNELITYSFDVSDGDTLRMYHTGDIQYPPVNPDGSDRTFEQDTSLFHIPDTVCYLLELIEDATNQRAGLLDSIIYLPAQSFFDYCSNIAESVYDTSYVGFRSYLVTRTEGIDLPQGSYRIRLTALSSAMMNGGVDSMFFASFEFAPRITKELNLVWDSLTQALISRMLQIDDSLSGAGKKRYGVRSNFVEANYRLYPTVLSQGNPFVSVTGVDSDFTGDIELHLYTTDGKLVSVEHTRKSVEGQEVVGLRLPVRLLRGAYVVIIHANQKYSVNVIVVR
ncbi:MAG: hypothetical protein KFH87_01695, partial [Bacteroidetes bacterium]|nr:hypothetical protein [Bacteroidota bacterium]